MNKPIVYINKENPHDLKRMQEWANREVLFSREEERRIIQNFCNSWHNAPGVVGQIAQHITSLEVRGMGAMIYCIKDLIAVGLKDGQYEID